MIDEAGALRHIRTDLKEDAGNFVFGAPVTACLRVSPDGTNADGLTWTTAYTTINSALTAASTDANACTLILIAPHATYYDINVTGDPTWAANVILMGTQRAWVEIRNTHVSATSVLKLTGKAHIQWLTINCGTANNGVIFTASGWRAIRCMFDGSSLTSAASCLWLDGTGGTRGRIESSEFRGNVTYTTGILVDNFARCRFFDTTVHDCLNGIQIVNAGSTENRFKDLDVGGCAIAFNIDAGVGQHLQTIWFHDNTTNIDDEVAGHVYENLLGRFPITLYPDDTVGTTVAASNSANTYGLDTALRAAVTADKPFRVTAVIGSPAVAQLHTLRLSKDAGTSHFAVYMIESARGVASSAVSGTEYIFNHATPISCSLKAESGGSDEMKVWLKIQEI